jgi:hypothetical protein
MSGAESIFLINPRRSRKRRKNPMPAGLRRYWASRRGGKKRRKARAVMTNPRRRRRNPARAHRRRARRRNPIFKKTRARRRRANPVFRRSRRRARHRNPFSVGGLKAVIVPAAIGAAGAIAMSIAYGYASPSLPATLSTGYFPTIVKAAAAIGIGMLVGKFMSRQDGQYATMGGLTVVLVGAITPLISSATPSIPGLSGLAGYGDYIPYSKPGMGAYMRNPTKRPGMGRLGFYSPAPVLGAPGPRQMGAYMARSVPGMADLTGGSGYNWTADGM